MNRSGKDEKEQESVAVTSEEVFSQEIICRSGIGAFQTFRRWKEKVKKVQKLV